jgi:hypothetical protein
MKSQPRTAQSSTTPPGGGIALGDLQSNDPHRRASICTGWRQTRPYLRMRLAGNDVNAESARNAIHRTIYSLVSWYLRQFAMTSAAASSGDLPFVEVSVTRRFRPGAVLACSSGTDSSESSGTGSPHGRKRTIFTERANLAPRSPVSTAPVRDASVAAHLCGWQGPGCPSRRRRRRPARRRRVVVGARRRVTGRRVIVGARQRVTGQVIALRAAAPRSPPVAVPLAHRGYLC